MSDSYETLEFSDSEAFRNWLDAHYGSTDGVWLKLHKKGSGLQSVTYAEALDVALCYGWIDGQRRSFDELSFLQKYTPRRARSLWSKRNIEHVTRLIDDGPMTTAGLEEITKAKADGRWEAAYDGPSSMVIPNRFLDELSKYPKAQKKFDAMSKSARYSIGWQLQTAKTQKTIDARQKRIIEQLDSDISL